MTLVIGTKENEHFAQKAFSLIEIVLVLALIALATSAVILNFDSFIGKETRLSTRESLSQAIRYARIEAAKQQTLTELYFNQEQGALVVALSTKTLKTFPLSDPNFQSTGNGAITFFLIPPAEGLKPFPSIRNADFELERIQFNSDRSSTPFIVNIDDGINPEETIVFDPFSHFPRQIDE
ncbi:MAG: type II secretion system protein [Verrucomicrobia bacterium]|jgi:prepilin-type N-terminal cleavage/methylation domain-containing protein|nr:type II secretion system protein [Verrucomicrobiota bacterium]